jgi:hypothetical protein
MRQFQIGACADGTALYKEGATMLAVSEREQTLAKPVGGLNLCTGLRAGINVVSMCQHSVFAGEDYCYDKAIQGDFDGWRECNKYLDTCIEENIDKF